MWAVAQQIFSGQLRHPLLVVSLVFVKNDLEVRSMQLLLTTESALPWAATFWEYIMKGPWHYVRCTVEPYPLWKGYPHVLLDIKHLGPLLMETAEMTNEYPAPRNPIAANNVEVNIWKGGETREFLDRAEIIHAQLHHPASLPSLMLNMTTVG